MRFERIEIQNGSTRATVSPARGGLVAGLCVGGAELLYLDEATFLDGGRSVRGGVPILIPFCGKLAGGVLAASGASMPQHGFGRVKRWGVVDRKPDRVVCELCSDHETRAAYPFAFAAEQTVTALERGLRIDLRVENVGLDPMPVSPGWHPYFNCPSELKGQVRVADGGAGSEARALEGFSSDMLTPDREFDFGLPAPHSGRVDCFIPGIGRIRLSFAPIMRHLQFWSPAGAPYICIEPFHGPDNAINTPARLEISPGAAAEFWISIELEPGDVDEGGPGPNGGDARERGADGGRS